MKLRMVVVVALTSLFALTLSGEALAQKNLGGPGVIAKEAESRPFLGIQMAKPEEGETGVRIEQVLLGSPADAAGLGRGDVIVKIEDAEITDIRSLQEALGKMKVGDRINFTVRRGEEEPVVGVTLGVTLGDRRKLAPRSQALQVPAELAIEAADGLSVTANTYAPNGVDAPCIVLCHQAGWSRGEYLEIAPKLNELGFNCFAIDQRSGGSVNGVVNETNKLATEKGKETAFLNAEQDMVAALKKVRESTKATKVILWGSSYSAALALRIAGEHPDLVEGVVAFAPGEYFERFGKPADWVEASAKKIADPAFVTSAKKEVPNWKSIFDAIPGDAKVMFVPETAGNHGSRALWEKFDDHEAYWESIEGFLSQFVEEGDLEEAESHEKRGDEEKSDSPDAK